MSKPTVLSRQYWDSCLFLDLVNKTEGRVDVLLALMDDLRETDARVVGVTSVLTIAEVAYATRERDEHKLDAEVLAKIDGFWAPESPIELVDVFPKLANEARDIMREVLSRGKRIRTYDALHFASARKRSVQEFLTYDKQLYEFSNWFGFRVAAPVSTRLPFERSHAEPKAQA